MTGTKASNGDAGSETTQGREEMALKIVSVIADAKGCKPLDLKPLYWVVDTEAIEQLVEQSSTVSFEISFDYEGGQVTVTSDGNITYEMADE
ncbi:hypothetical protein C499_06520 [Halogeometricum borinquense DSM 11551]|uniref:Halobacterial output domain-containing protein n=2 Tax=Halogeometricum borinquense TaxID=60847 RepID=E4NV17_HALBP|nr:HalOD1 output domain-containing protein [Halogeometricum borinquense]ADQ69006.1 hypothetical protein Hbor_34860 [Halogeometricum borinquense DSM 11551]ELY29491.1 hypothetical protein C499_06520 [Halogeometricum borinquense DSM 11551]RYJ08186.1 hypothetical protein ELS19_16600 [Halogeometricum borinquense]